MAQNEPSLNDLEEREQPNRVVGSGWRKYSFPGLIGLAVVLFLFVLLLIFGGSKEEKQAGKGDDSGTGSVEARLNKLEFQHRMLMEDVNKLRESGLQVSQKELAKLRKAVADLEERLAGLEEKLDKGSQPSREADAGEERRAEGPSRYTVEKGDTLFSIGQEYEVTVEQLRQWNDLGPQEYIQPGQELKVAE